MKIVTIVGARPQFVKAAALSREFKKHTNIEEVILHTGQHFDKNMSDVFFEEMQIPHPKYNLNINSLSHGAMTGRMLEEIENILILEKPDYLLVYGDTNSTLAGALAAKKLHIKVVHIEAGLRSFNMAMPEEVNRILTDRISDILFCPTSTAIDNLEREGFSNFESLIFNVGDVMQDAALFYEKQADQNSDILKHMHIKKNEYYLCTLHRAENTNNMDRLASIIKGLNNLPEKYQLVLPIHPRTKQLLNKFKLNTNIKIIAPVGYFDMIQLIKNSRLVITDSGGLQKEAYFFNKFCITTRDQTEWTELVSHGYNKIVGADSKRIIESVKYFESITFHKEIELYGGGLASQKIVSNIIEHFSNK
jgi:UDP-GlcNAc3NAcA epimerase